MRIWDIPPSDLCRQHLLGEHREFTYATLPAGWKIEPTDHSMHSNLVDEKGRTRASIFYKAAFYDRKADIHAVRRYRAEYDYDNDTAGAALAYDGKRIIHTTEPFPYNANESWKTSDAACKLAYAWLDQNFPQWQDPSAYWD